MGRFAQLLSTKGSQRWLQWLVNESPDRLAQEIGLGPITWLSPVRADDHAEYRDQAFLDLLDIRLPTRPLAFFWPRGGPQWDGLGRAPSGEVILVEAKAHLCEARFRRRASGWRVQLVHRFGKRGLDLA